VALFLNRPFYYSVADYCDFLFTMILLAITIDALFRISSVIKAHTLIMILQLLAYLIIFLAVSWLAFSDYTRSSLHVRNMIRFSSFFHSTIILVIINRMLSQKLSTDSKESFIEVELIGNCNGLGIKSVHIK
jgi:hypothetical protein